MTFPLFDLTGRRALITGSGRGIGLTLAKGLASHGATIVLSDRDGSVLGDAVQSFGKGSNQVTSVEFDVTDEKAVAAAVGKIERDMGPIDILINNAGIVRRVMLLEENAANFEDVLRVHVIGSFNVGRAVATHMIGRKRGKIINIASIMSDIARASTGPYTAAKGALKLLTKTMCAEWGPQGLNVNAIGPGFLKTELTRAMHDDAAFNTWLGKRVPQGRWGTPDDLVGAAIFLASPASDFVNGHLLLVDGGVLSVL